MAHLWIADPVGEWCVCPLSPPRVEFGSVRVDPVEGPIDEAGARVTAGALLHTPEPDPGAWLLIAPLHEPIAVNGLPLIGGVRLLDDRDEIRLPDGWSCFFSDEEPARMDPMPAAEKPMNCPRCRQAIAPGSPAVRCPSCGIWHHQQEGLECWTYSAACALCPQPTALNGGYRWTPAEL